MSVSKKGTATTMSGRAVPFWKPKKEPVRRKPVTTSSAIHSAPANGATVCRVCHLRLIHAGRVRL